jgi:hypothetical protein
MVQRHQHMVFFSHFIWAFSLMFLFGGGYWQINESIVWAHNKLNLLQRFNHVH